MAAKDTKKKGQKGGTYLIAAFAIEDRVDFRCVEADSKSAALSGPPLVEFSRSIRPRQRRDQSDFYEQIYSCIRSALLELRERLIHSKPKGDPPVGVFDSLDAIAVSMIGVIADSRKLIQLTLFNWTSEKRVSWNKDGKSVVGFDFVNVICDIIREISPETDIRRLAARIIVVNDATACAVAEGNRRRPTARFIYLKAHSGINIGIIDDGDAFIRSEHTEMGHFYPNLHHVDTNNRFAGACRYHGACLEGMISLRSLMERARPTALSCLAGKPAPAPIQTWGKIVDELEGRGLEQPALDLTLFDTLFKRPSRQSTTRDADVADIAAHYLAQLVHWLILSPLMPDYIVIGGRFATKRVVDKIRDNVWLRTKGYPARAITVDRAALGAFIKAKPRDAERIEMMGALTVAWWCTGAADKRRVGLRTIRFPQHEHTVPQIRPPNVPRKTNRPLGEWMIGVVDGSKGTKNDTD
jgi:predicted NBD/HSP70 family sugar kinase